MTFISYAQNFEDVMLWRALCEIRNGFYVDVGACSPDEDSVTRAFHERGWRGINIEPNPAWRWALEERRPEDVNLILALGAEPGVTELYVFGELAPGEGRIGYAVGDTGLTTTDVRTAEHHARRGLEFRAETCAVLTLNLIWETYVGSREVHFLKVDVEGCESAVIGANDWKRHRPWVVLVEATQPSSQVPVFDAWETLLTDAGYRFVFGDGLNRFYLADEHEELASRFAHGPNVFDGFKPSAQAAAEALATMLGDELGRVETRMARIQLRLSELGKGLSQKTAELAKAKELAANLDVRLRERDATLADVETRSSELETELYHKRAQLGEVESLAAELREQLRQRETMLIDAEKRSSMLEAMLGQVRAQLAQAEASAAEVQKSLEQARERGAGLQAEVLAIHRTKTWRLTAPLRTLYRRALDSKMSASRLLHQWVFLPARSLSDRRLARAALRSLLHNRALRRVGGRLVAGRPSIKARLLELAGEAQFAPATSSGRTRDLPGIEDQHGAVDRLPETAQAIYSYLLDLYRARPGGDV